MIINLLFKHGETLVDKECNLKRKIQFFIYFNSFLNEDSKKNKQCILVRFVEKFLNKFPAQDYRDIRYEYSMSMRQITLQIFHNLRT